MDFQEADRRFFALKRQYDNGALSDDEYRAQLEQLAVQDVEGRWWVKHRDTGEWYYQDGESWIQGAPYREQDNSGDKLNREALRTEPRSSDTPQSEGDVITVQETPRWWTPLGRGAAIVSFIIPRVGILLPLIGIILGYRTSQIGNTNVGNVTMTIGAVCLLLRLLQLVLVGW